MQSLTDLEAIFLLNAMSESECRCKNHGRKTIATLGDWIMPLMPVLKEILLRLIVQRKIGIKPLHQPEGVWLCMQHEITEMLRAGKVPSSTALRSLVLLV
jgi:hypothetical protein